MWRGYHLFWSLKLLGTKNVHLYGWNPSLVVIGGDSCSEGFWFESQHHILDGHFSHLFAVRIVMFVWKDENKRKRVRDGHFFKDMLFLNKPKKSPASQSPEYSFPDLKWHSPILFSIVRLVDVNDGLGHVTGKGRKYGSHPESLHSVQDLVLEIDGEGVPLWKQGTKFCMRRANDIQVEVTCKAFMRKSQNARFPQN